MSRITLRCKMQDNGFTAYYGRELSLAECREIMGCTVDGPRDCGECPVLEVGIIKKQGRKAAA